MKRTTEVNAIENLASSMRKTALKVAFECNEPAHIGGGMSIIDILATLYGYVMTNPGVVDRFILSKGHGVLGLYSALHAMNFISDSELETFQTNGSDFIAHPIMNESAGIESSNGSLGQGLSFAIGIALAYKKKRKPGRIYVILGDGECYEGSIWEAAITATEQMLDNLTVFVDCNGHQNDGAVTHEMEFKAIAKKWAGFGWNTLISDGHDIADILAQLNKCVSGVPNLIVARTIKGRGVSFMENNNDWHHNRLSEKLYQDAMKELLEK